MNHLLLEMNYLELCQNFCEMIPVAGARLELSNSILLSNLVFIPFIPGHWEKSFSIGFECIRDDSIVFCTSVQWFSQAAQLTRGEPDKTVIGQAIKFTLSSLKSLNGKVKFRCLKTGRSFSDGYQNMRRVVSTDTVSATSFTFKLESDGWGRWSWVDGGENHLKHVSQVDREVHPVHKNISISSTLIISVIIPQDFITSASPSNGDTIINTIFFHQQHLLPIILLL